MPKVVSTRKLSSPGARSEALSAVSPVLRDGTVVTVRCVRHSRATLSSGIDARSRTVRPSPAGMLRRLGVASSRSLAERKRCAAAANSGVSRRAPVSTATISPSGSMTLSTSATSTSTGALPWLKT